MDDPGHWEAAARLAQGAPQPATVGKLRCGTAGWTDRSLIQSGRFYPPGKSSARERLGHYARHFDLVEVDATYYALMSVETTRRWVEATPAGFRFDVKAFPLLTGHPIDVLRLPNDLRAVLEPLAPRGRIYPDRLPGEVAREIEDRFRASLAPLADAGRLSSVLCQFPPWFTATRGHARALIRLSEQYEDLPLTVEFRHPSWLAPERQARVFQLLRDHRLGYVVVDEPDTTSGGVPPVLAVTNERLAVVRFHGHNRAGWEQPGATVQQRFDYLYTPDQLGGWVEPLRCLDAEAQEVHAVFNNCVRDYAVLNAKGLSVLLGGHRSGVLVSSPGHDERE